MQHSENIKALLEKQAQRELEAMRTTETLKSEISSLKRRLEEQQKAFEQTQLRKSEQADTIRSLNERINAMAKELRAANDTSRMWEKKVGFEFGA